MIRDSIKLALKHLALPLYYRFPPTGLEPARLLVWLNVLKDTVDVPGAVVEVGVMCGGTSILSSKLLRKLPTPKRYLAIDTFQGFVAKQFSDDAHLGTSWTYFHTFSANSKSLVARVLRLHGCDKHVELMQNDICTMLSEELPDPISACLLDVDLSVPTYEGLNKIWPRLAKNGVIVVDDCLETKDGWQARKGYQSFCSETGLQEEYMFGAGIVRKL